MSGPGAARTDPLRWVLDRIGLGARAVRQSSASAWGSLTSGQRWSGGVLLAVAVLVVGFGLPSPTEVRRVPGGAASAVVPSDDLVSAPGPEDGTTGSATPRSGSEPGSASAPVAGESPPGPSGSSSDDVDSGRRRGPAPQFVALVRTGDGALSGWDDATIADAFLADAAFDATVVELSEDGEPDEEAGDTEEDQCAEVRGAGNVVLASVDLPDALRTCLVIAGVTIVAHDSAGSTPEDSGPGGIVSTRRGRTDSLTDLGRWGIESGVLEGRVGIVVSSEWEGDVRRAVPALRRLGLQIRAVTVLPEGTEGSMAVSAGVSDHVDKSIDVVVFAARMEHQREWVLQQAVVQPGVGYVVSDVGEGVVEEGYPPTFEGRAHTSLRTPWFEREEGATRPQQRCLERWEATSDLPVPSRGSEELARVYMWCQVVTLMVEPALERYARGASSFDAALRERSVASPLTSILGPLPGGGFGPTQDAVLTWDRPCRCWTPERGFDDSARPRD